METVQEILIRHRDNASDWKTLNEMINAVFLPAMKEIAELSWEAALNRQSGYNGDNNQNKYPDKEQFLSLLFPEQ